MINWKGRVRPGVSNALFSQLDLLASFAALFNQPIPANDARDSQNHLDVLLGKSITGRTSVVEGNIKEEIAIVKGDWKYIPPNNGPVINKLTNIELGNSLQPQLYNLKIDAGEKNNLATKYPNKVKELERQLKTIIGH